jgi:hypothetical protein
MSVSGVVKRISLAGLVTAGLLIALAPAAFADTATISFTTAGGQSDPVAGVPRVFTVTGTAAVPERLFVRFRATGGAPCAPTAISDSGSTIDGTPTYSQAVNGSFTEQGAVTLSDSGTFLYCIWLASDSSTVTAPISQTITVRKPTGTISATLLPVRPRQNQQTTVTITGASEAPEAVFAAVQSAGVQCAPTYSADQGTGLTSNTPVNGAFTVTATLTAGAPGNYTICLWLAGSSSDPTPIAGPQVENFTVPAPLRCVVPTSVRGHLAAVEKRLAAAHCLVGRVRSVHSSSVHKGDVVSVSPGPGTTHGFHAHININVSSGAKRRRHR